jgi:DNA-binding NtrC family response regulator
VRTGLERLLRSAGIDAYFAVSVADGWEKLGQAGVAVIDLRLPDGLGTELIRRAREAGYAVRFAVFSGLQDLAEIVAASGERAEAVFRKPDDADQIVEWILATLADQPKSSPR